MARHEQVALADGMVATICFTGAADGDFQVRDPAPDLQARRRDLIDRPWSWLLQVHGNQVFEVTAPGEHAGREGDGLVTASIGSPISVTTADCAPLVLLAEGGVATIHAGWRGLVDGVIERGARLLADIGGQPVGSRLGPCIHPHAYEFGRDELDQVIARFGPTVEGATDSGHPALDLPAAVAVACEAAGWPRPTPPAQCTSGAGYYSHRTQADIARQVAVAWLDEA